MILYCEANAPGGDDEPDGSKGMKKLDFTKGGIENVIKGTLVNMATAYDQDKPEAVKNIRKGERISMVKNSAGK